MRKLGRIELAKRKMTMRVRAAAKLQCAEAYLDLLNEMLPAEEANFDKRVQQGELPKPLDLKKALGG